MYVSGGAISTPRCAGTGGALAVARRPARGIARFCREGDFWRIEFAGVAAFVSHVQGLTKIAYLLARPGVDVSVADLFVLGDGRRALRPDVVEPFGYGHSADCVPVLDRPARVAYARRLSEISRMLCLPQRPGNFDETAALRCEAAFLAAELRGAHGLGRRQRVLGDSRGRLRSNVCRALRAGVGVIALRHEALAIHLDAALETGALCRYAPRQPGPIWYF